MAQIPLANGGCATVDDADLPIVSSFAWRGQTSPSGIYVVSGDGLLMHRLILNAPDGVMVDHINGNPSDNRRENLRLCTHAENMRNRKIAKHNKCGLKGVYQDTRKKKWRAEIVVDGKRFTLGSHATKELAHAAYCAAAKSLHGQFARFE
jgi:hypothetical protein